MALQYLRLAHLAPRTVQDLPGGNGTLLKAGIVRLLEEGQDTKEASVMG